MNLPPNLPAQHVVDLSNLQPAVLYVNTCRAYGSHNGIGSVEIDVTFDGQHLNKATIVFKKDISMTVDELRRAIDEATVPGAIVTLRPRG